MRYRKKPIVIEAIQFFPPKVETLSYSLKFDEWVDSRRADRKVTYRKDKLYISTLEGEMEASPGDWIIRGVEGELYPCKPDIFEKTYEKVE